MNSYTVRFYYESMRFGGVRTFSENAIGESIQQVAEVVRRELEKKKFITDPMGSLIPVSAIGEIEILGGELI